MTAGIARDAGVLTEPPARDVRGRAVGGGMALSAGMGVALAATDSGAVDRRIGDHLLRLWDEKSTGGEWLRIEDLGPTLTARLAPTLFRVRFAIEGEGRLEETGAAVRALDDALAAPGAAVENFRSDTLRRPIMPLAKAVASVGRPLSRSVRRPTLDGGALLFRAVLAPLGDPRRRPLSILGLLAFRWTDASGAVQATAGIPD